MKERAALEIRRQAFHMAYGIALVVLIAQGIVNWEVLAGLVAAGLFVSLSSRKRRLPAIARLLDVFGRDDEKEAMPGRGMLFFTLGALVAVVLFPRDVALASLMVLTFGDALSHLFGRFMGRIPSPWNAYKLVEGTIIGFLAGSIGAAVFVPWLPAIAGAAVAMLVEGFEMKFREQSIDDNLTIPVIAGLVMLFF